MTYASVLEVWGNDFIKADSDGTTVYSVDKMEDKTQEYSRQFEQQMKQFQNRKRLEELGVVFEQPVEHFSSQNAKYPVHEPSSNHLPRYYQRPALYPYDTNQYHKKSSPHFMTQPKKAEELMRNNPYSGIHEFKGKQTEVTPEGAMKNPYVYKLKKKKLNDNDTPEHFTKDKKEDPIDLDNVSLNDLIAYMEKKGYIVSRPNTITFITRAIQDAAPYILIFLFAFGLANVMNAKMNKK